MFKKLTAISLVASACLFTNVYAENTLEEAFANGKVKGEVRAYFNQEKQDDSKSSSITHYGGFLSYETADINGLSVGGIFQVSSVADINGANRFSGDEDASGAVLSEAYLAYTRDNTSLKIGRQFIGTPLVAGSGSRMIRQSFQGYTLTNTDLPQTKIIALYVDRFQGRTNGKGNPGEFTKTFNTNVNGGSFGAYERVLNDGAYSLYAQNKSISNLTITGQYVDAVDVFSTMYLDSLYNFKTMNELYVKGQYIGTNYDTSEASGDFFAVRVGAKYKNFNF